MTKSYKLKGVLLAAGLLMLGDPVHAFIGPPSDSSTPPLPLNSASEEAEQLQSKSSHFATVPEPTTWVFPALAGLAFFLCYRASGKEMNSVQTRRQ